MWIELALLSAVLLGFYDFSKKQALKDNAVPLVLLINTAICACLMLPLLLNSECEWGLWQGSRLSFEPQPFRAHLLVMLKSLIVLSSWVTGYIGIKHLPLTIVGPINATRPVLVLLGALILFGERLNTLQWGGVVLSFTSIFLLSFAGRREGINFIKNKYIAYVIAAALLGAASGLYDKHIMQHLEPLFVQSWYNLYQMIMMAFAVSIIALKRHFNKQEPMRLKWHWAIMMIPLLLTAADMAYFIALGEEGAMISVISTLRRGSVIVSFACGAILLREKNLRAKAIDLIFILIGMILLWFGSHN